MIKWKHVFEFSATIIIPLLYLYNILVIYLTPDTISANYNFKIIGIVIAILGLSLWIISLINLKHSFGVLPQKQKRIKTGLYKYFNHPMYIGIWATFLGLSLANSSWQGLVFLNLIMMPLLYIRAYFEDKHLR